MCMCMSSHYYIVFIYEVISHSPEAGVNDIKCSCQGYIIPHIAGNYQGRKLLWIGKNLVTILLRKLSRNAKPYHRCVRYTPNFVEKTFAGGSKSAKFVNDFSLKRVFHHTVYITCYNLTLSNPGHVYWPNEIKSPV